MKKIGLFVIFSFIMAAPAFGASVVRKANYRC